MGACLGRDQKLSTATLQQQIEQNGEENGITNDTSENQGPETVFLDTADPPSPECLQVSGVKREVITKQNIDDLVLR